MDPTKPQVISTDQKSQDDSSARLNSQLKADISHQASKDEPIETEEIQEVRQIIDQKFGMFRDKFEHEQLRKADDDIETYIDKHSKVKKKK